MFACLCKCKSTNCTKIDGWALDSKNLTTNGYAIVEILSFFSLWEGKKSPNMPL